MGCGGYHDHAGGCWFFALYRSCTYGGFSLCVRTCTLPLPTFSAYLGAGMGVWLFSRCGCKGKRGIPNRRYSDVVQDSERGQAEGEVGAAIQATLGEHFCSHWLASLWL